MTWQEDAEIVRDWEPDQSKHGHYCGIQGPHSVGHGQKGSCTCGRDELVAEVARLTAALDEKDEMIKAALAWHGDSLRERDEARERVEELEAALRRLYAAPVNPTALALARAALREGDEK